MHIHTIHPAHNQSIDQHNRQHDAAVEAYHRYNQRQRQRQHQRRATPIQKSHDT